MNRTRQRIGFVMPNTLIALLTSTMLATGCVQVRLLTYPSEFHWLDSSSVKGVMHEMALSMGKLDRLVDQAAGPAKAKQAHMDIIAELTAIEEQAISLSSGTSNNTGDARTRPVTNHLLIDEHIDDFVDQTMRARFLAEADPPNYYGIGRLTGNCTACHRMR